MTEKLFHIGELIQDVLTEQNISVTEFAAKLKKSRSNVYYIFKSDNINTDLLIEISQMLNTDFFKCFTENLNIKPKT